MQAVLLGGPWPPGHRPRPWRCQRTPCPHCTAPRWAPHHPQVVSADEAAPNRCLTLAALPAGIALLDDRLVSAGTAARPAAGLGRARGQQQL
eukprot:191537-Rhodomonas_salina.1